MQAKGRLQCWNADGQELGGSCRQGCAGKGQVATLEQHRLMARLGGSCQQGAMYRQGRVLGILGVLGVWSLANGRLEGPNKRGLCAGKGQAAMLERWRPGAWWKLPPGMCRQRAGCNPGAAQADGQAWWKLPGRNWKVLGVLGVLGVWSLANGRLECRLECHNKGLCAGKGGF